MWQKIKGTNQYWEEGEKGINYRCLNLVLFLHFYCNCNLLMSYPILSYPILSYHIISYHIISYHIISYHVISYHIISCHVMSCHIISYHVISWQIRLRQFLVAGLRTIFQLNNPCILLYCIVSYLLYCIVLHCILWYCFIQWFSLLLLFCRYPKV